MKGFIEEYGKIIVVIILTLLMLGFGQTGLAKPLQNSLLKSTVMITNAHNKFDEVTKEPEPVTPGAIIDIEGTKYIVLEERENNQALIMTASSIGRKAFQSNYDKKTGRRPDGQYANTYEGSKIDNYLENEWYNGLSSTMKVAIRTTNIKQVAYDIDENKQETGSNGQVYNTISRHVFLPSVSELGKVVDLKSKDKVIAFLKNSQIWTRDSYKSTHGGIDRGEFVWKLQGFTTGGLTIPGVTNLEDTSPAFVIDLSKVDYKVAGHTDYK